MAKHPEAESQVSRRSFLSGAAAGIAGGAAADIAGSPLLAASVSGHVVEELRTDVVAVGGGIGGLTAALRAQKVGARVLVLEKASEPGGTTFHSGGTIHHPSYEEMRANVPEGDPDVQWAVAENIDKWGEFMESVDAPIGAPGRTGLRTIAPVIWVRFIVRTIESDGGKIMVETPMIRLLTNRQNEIIGVLADSPRGVIRIFAKAVVLATGGWMTNAQMVQQCITRYFGSLRQRNVSFNGKPPFLGDGLFAALQLGAQPSAGGFDSFYGHLMVARPGKITEAMNELSATFAPWGVALNKFGRRFTDEAQGKLTGRQMSLQGEELCVQEVARQPDAMAAYVCDDVVYKQHACDNCALGATGTYMQFKMAGAPTALGNTLPELAKQMEDWGVGMAAETVLREVAEYNRAAKNGKAWALPIPKTSAKHALILENPPFYAVLGQAGITATHGGVRVNALGQVLHRSGKPIPGLFAAGVDIGNFNNCAYLGNLNLGAAYGYISGGKRGEAARSPGAVGTSRRQFRAEKRGDMSSERFLGRRNRPPFYLAAFLGLVVIVLPSLGRDARQSPSSAEEVYFHLGCWNCHGKTGQAGRQALPIAKTRLPLQRFIGYVRLPKGMMPPYAPRLASDAELMTVYRFLDGADTVQTPPAVTVDLKTMQVGSTREAKAGVAIEATATLEMIAGKGDGPPLASLHYRVTLITDRKGPANQTLEYRQGNLQQWLKLRTDEYGEAVMPLDRSFVVSDARQTEKAKLQLRMPLPLDPTVLVIEALDSTAPTKPLVVGIGTAILKGR